MPEPVKLVTPTKIEDEIRCEVVEELEQALQRAKTGETAAVLIVERHPNGNWSFARSGAMDFPSAIGYLHLAIQAWTNAYLREPD